jgi:hypothetical protein
MDHRWWWCSMDSLWNVLLGCCLWVVVEENGFLYWEFIHGISPTKVCGCLWPHTCSSKVLKVCIVAFCLKKIVVLVLFFQNVMDFLFSWTDIVIIYLKVKYSYIRMYRKLADPDKKLLLYWNFVILRLVKKRGLTVCYSLILYFKKFFFICFLPKRMQSEQNGLR